MPELTEAEALTRLTLMTQAGTDPTLTSAELTELLNMSLIPDAEGRVPDDSGYVDRWDLRRAAAEGWLWKAGKVSARYSFASDGGQAHFERDQLYKHCIDMHARYKGTKTYSLVVERDDIYWDPLIGNLNGG